MKRTFSMACAVGGVLVSVAETAEIPVGNRYRTFIHSDVSLVADTQKVSAYPLSFEPLYWLDASDTTGWDVDSETGEVRVTAAKGTSGRHLTSRHEDIRIENYTQQGQAPLWYGSLPKVKGPVLSVADGTVKNSYLDFGEIESYRGLWFNPLAEQSDASVSNNTLQGIGTVIGVFKSKAGGGQILGGRQWFRQVGPNALLRSWNFAPASIYNGVLRFGLLQTAIESATWPSDWTVVSLNPTEATLSAEGVGCGSPEELDGAFTCGGQSVGEMMVFDRVLDGADVEKLVHYLQHKWLGADEPGWNGNARVTWLEIGGKKETNSGSYPQEGVEIPVATSSDEILSIGRLNGGRAYPDRHTLAKTGVGTLVLEEARDFGGTVDVREGTLRIGGKLPPTFDDLPENMTFHFDASDIDSLTVDGDDVVSSVESRGTLEITAYQDNASLRPKLVRNTPAQGLNLIDFGPRELGAYMSYRRTEGAATRDYVTMATVVAVVDARFYGFNLGDSFMARPNDWYYDGEDWRTWYPSFLKNMAFYINDHVSLNPLLTGGKVRVNGLDTELETEGFDTPGFAVLTYRVAPHDMRMLGGRIAACRGGFRLAEMMAWPTSLSDGQVRDVESYLMKKWMNRTALGYADVSGVPDVQYLRIGNGGTVEVPENCLATVGRIVDGSRLVKTGSGVLNVVSGTEGTGEIVVKGGSVAVTFGADVSNACELAVSPALHVDPSDATMVKTFAENGTNFVQCIGDRAGRTSAYYMGPSYMRTWITTDPTEVCNGLAVVDFGPLEPSWGNGDPANGSQPVSGVLGWSRNLLNIRSCYMVYNSDNGGGQPFGWYDLDSNGRGLSNIDMAIGGRHLDFYRADTVVPNETALFANSSPSVRKGELYVDGVLTNMTYVPKGGWHLIELHTAGPVQANCFGNAFDYYVHGGFRMGETLVFERQLSERERVATRNYLLQKWLPNVPCAELPARDPATLPGSLTFDGSSVWRVAVDSEDAVAPLRLTGTLKFTAGATLKLTGLSALGDLFGRKITIAHANDYVGLDAVTVTGDVDFTSQTHPRLVRRANGALQVCFGKKGFVVFLR